MSEALAQLKMGRVVGVISTAISLKDKSLLLEKEVGLEPFYTMIAMGQSLTSLASSIDVSAFELEYMLSRTPTHQKEYMNAVATQLAKSSSVTLGRFAHSDWLTTDQSAAAKHHASMLEKSLKVLNSSKGDEGTGNVVVNNTIVVRSSDEIPPLPDELQNVIEVESEDVEFE